MTVWLVRIEPGGRRTFHRLTLEIHTLVNNLRGQPRNVSVGFAEVVIYEEAVGISEQLVDFVLHCNAN